MQLAAGYVVSPGVCCSCGTGDTTKPVVDVGTEIPGQRRYHIFLCGECAITAGQTVAELMGYRLERFDPMQPTVRELTSRTIELEGRLATANALLAELADYATELHGVAAEPVEL